MATLAVSSSPFALQTRTSSSAPSPHTSSFFLPQRIPACGIQSGNAGFVSSKGLPYLKIRAKDEGAREGKVKPGQRRTFDVEVEKPVGLTLGKNERGFLVITSIEPGGNAEKHGLRVGDQVIYTNGPEGEEYWPATKLGFTKRDVYPKPFTVYFCINRTEEIDVLKLWKILTPATPPDPEEFGLKGVKWPDKFV